jgi:tyrosine-protein kinase Etk/Wzc
MSNPVLFREFSPENGPGPLRFVEKKEEESKLHLDKIGQTLLEGKWLIVLMLFIAFITAGFYTIIRKPAYEANMLIHVEEEAVKDTKSAFTEMGSMFTLKTTSYAEIELVRSRLVLGRALDRVNNYISADPMYFPLVGEWLSKNLKGRVILSGFAGFAWGTEQIKVAAFYMPDALLNEEFVITTEGSGAYVVTNKNGAVNARGKTGTPLLINTVYGPIEILVTQIDGAPGTRFTVKRRTQQAMINEVLQNLQVKELGKQSAVIRVALRGTDPWMLNTVLSRIGEEYIEQNSARKTQEANKALAFLNKQLPELKRQLEESENKYNQFRSVNGTINVGEESKLTLQQLVIAKSRKIDLEQKRNELLIRFTPEHPVLIGLDKQLREVNTEIRNFITNIKTLPTLEQEVLKLSRDVTVNTELYMSLLNTARQLRLVTVSATSNVRLVDIPMMPEQPISLSALKVFAFAALSGLLAGIAAAFARRSIKHGVEDPLEIEEMVNLPVYATIPYSSMQYKLQSRRTRGTQKVPLLAQDASRDPSMESLRKFRAVLGYTLSQARNNVVLILSPTARNGKSFISSNLAVLFGLANKRVLIIDADLRNGDLHHYFNVPQNGGLTEALSGAKHVEELIRREVAPNVDLITSGTLLGESELLLRPALQSLLELLSVRYDVVLINGAPLLEVSDSLALGTHAGSIYVVAKANVSTVREIGETVRILRQAGLSAKGCILNSTKTRSNHYAYQYQNWSTKQWSGQYLPRKSRHDDTFTAKAS